MIKRQRSWGLLIELVRADFKTRYQALYLGYMWTVLQPLVTFLILHLVFSHFFSRDIPQYSLYLFSGIIFWNLFSEGTTVGLNSLHSKARLFTRVPVSYALIIVAASVLGLVTFSINAAIFSGFYWIAGLSITPRVLLTLVVGCLLTYLLALTVSFILAPLRLHVPDLSHVWGIAMRLGFFATPIIYPLQAIPIPLQQWLLLNPIASIIVWVRAAVLMPDKVGVQTLAMTVVAIGVLGLCAHLLWRPLTKTIAEKI